MMQVQVRRGGLLDLGPAADLLNEIIAIGGTTALVQPITRHELGDWFHADPARSAWHVAIAEDGTLMGFQWIGPYPDELPPEACDITSFVRPGQTGLGIGSKLFDATRQAALDLGYDWINANIRADNEGGLIYYQSRGFRVYGHLENVRLTDGTNVNKVLKRYDLKD